MKKKNFYLMKPKISMNLLLTSYSYNLKNVLYYIISGYCCHFNSVRVPYTLN